MGDDATNVLNLGRARDQREDRLRAAIINATLELADRDVDRIAGDLGADPHDVCCSLMLAVLKRMASDGDNPYDALDWVAEALEFLKEAEPFRPGTGPDR